MEQVTRYQKRAPRIRDRIRSSQALRGWHNRDLARAAGISPATLRRWLGPRHHWSAKQIVLLSGALGFEAIEVVGAAVAAEIERDPRARFNQRGEQLEPLPTCPEHRPAPGCDSDGRCSSCGRVPCAHDAEPGAAP